MGAKIDRRDLLATGGVAAAAATLGLGSARAASQPAKPWDHEADIICVGSGAAACSAAITASMNGARVLIVEKEEIMGGTTGKSGGVAWIPNSPYLRARGLTDDRADCLRYMVRYGYSQYYDPASPTLGISAKDFALLEAFYDNAAGAIEQIEKSGAVKFREFRMYHMDKPAPDYADHLPENKTPNGRCVEPASGGGALSGGASLAGQMEEWLRAKNIPILMETRAEKLIMENGRVIGLEASAGDRKLRLRARKAVIFGTGGYAHNTELIDLHQISLYGSCARPSATGDFIPIAGAVGAKMGSLHDAWRSEVLLEEALDNRAVGICVDVPAGDSMILVNKYGKRVVNEKRSYNDRSEVHMAFDPTNEDYPNQLLFMLFDERCLDSFGGSYPLPASAAESPYIISGADWDELFANIGTRLEKLKAHTGQLALGQEFGANAKAAIKAFDGYAKAGVDPEFGRGGQAYDREWHFLFTRRREGTKYPPNPYPNPVMHPFAGKGPYYAFILAAGALDTCGGPKINDKAQVVDNWDKPIPGLYGAGNCIASPSRRAYFGGGNTIGLALTFGHVAALNGIKEAVA